MFDVDTLVADCRAALTDTDPRRVVRELLVRTLEKPGDAATALGSNTGGINIIYNAPDLTLLNVIWAPNMTLWPHDHRMWAVIGIYGGAEDNTLYRREQPGIRAAGMKELRDGDVLALGTDAIHSVHNPMRKFTGAIHVYGGDFVNQPRSQWDPDSLTEQPYSIEPIMKAFADANAEWAAQLGHDLDDEAI